MGSGLDSLLSLQGVFLWEEAQLGLGLYEKVSSDFGRCCGWLVGILC